MKIEAKHRLSAAPTGFAAAEKEAIADLKTKIRVMELNIAASGRIKAALAQFHPQEEGSKPGVFTLVVTEVGNVKVLKGAIEKAFKVRFKGNVVDPTELAGAFASIELVDKGHEVRVSVDFDAEV